MPVTMDSVLGAVRRWAVVATLVALAVMSALATAEHLGNDPLPDGDSAYVGMRIRDATSSHPPLVGMPTTLSTDAIEANHIGPLEFYVLGVLDRVFLRSWWSVWIGAAVVSWAALATCVLAARRAWGPGAAVLAGLSGFWLTWAMGSDILTSILNTEPPITAALAGCFCLMAALHGSPRWLVGAVFWMSYAAQAHLSFGPLGIVAAGTAVVIALLPRTRLDRRWRLAVVLVAAVVWAPVLFQQVRGNGGNLTALWNATRSDSGAAPAGMEFATALGAEVAGLPPPFGARPYVQVLVTPYELVRWPILVPVVAAAVLLVLARKRSQPVGALVGAALLLVGAILTTSRAAVVFAGVPRQYVRMLWPTALAFWFAATMTAVRLRPLPRAGVVAGWVALAVALVVMTPAAGTTRRDFGHADVAAANRIARDAVNALLDRPRREDGEQYLLHARGFLGVHGLGPSLVNELERRGIAVLALRDAITPVRSYRPFRVVEPGAVDGTLLYVGPPDGAPTGGEVLTRVGGLDDDAARLLEDLDDDLLAAIERGEGSRLLPGSVLAYGEVTPARAEELVRSHIYADMLFAQVVLDPPLAGEDLRRYEELVRAIDPAWQIVVTVGGNR